MRVVDVREKIKLEVAVKDQSAKTLTASLIEKPTFDEMKLS